MQPSFQGPFYSVIGVVDDVKNGGLDKPAGTEIYFSARQLAGAFGQAGDLGESVLKRSTGVKDSGAIVPGHGGILDRVDALMLTSAVTYLYSIWFLAKPS